MNDTVVVCGRVSARGLRERSPGRAAVLRRVHLRRGPSPPRQHLRQPRRGPRSRRAIGVGDVAGERGDRAPQLRRGQSGRLVDGNNRKVASSGEWFASRSVAVRAARNVQATAPVATIPTSGTDANKLLRRMLSAHNKLDTRDLTAKATALRVPGGSQGSLPLSLVHGTPELETITDLLAALTKASAVPVRSERRRSRNPEANLPQRRSATNHFPDVCWIVDQWDRDGMVSDPFRPVRTLPDG